MSKEQYVSFEVAQILKEKGFNWECNSWFAEYVTGVELHTDIERRNYNDDNVSLYDGLFSAPTQQMTMDWLRHKGFHVQVIYDVVLKWAVEIISLTETVQYDYEEAKMYHPSKQAGFDKYEDAAEVGIKYVLENLI